MKLSNQAVLQYSGDWIIQHIQSYDIYELAILGYLLDEISEVDRDCCIQKTNKITQLKLEKLCQIVKNVHNYNLYPITDSIETALATLIKRNVIMLNRVTREKRFVSMFVCITLVANDVTFEYSYHFIPFMLDAKKKNPQGRWHYVLQFNKSNAAALFTLTQRYIGQEITFSIDELKREFSLVGLYTKYNNFKQKVLIDGCEEINNLTDLHIEFKEILMNKKVELIHFNIQLK